MSNKSKLKRKQRQQELLKNFEGDFYQEKLINGQWFVKMFNGHTRKWQVAIYSEDSFRRYKSYQEQQNRLNHLLDKE